MTDEEFIAEMLARIPIRYKNKRRFAIDGLSVENPQILNHWINRGKVPGDWKPKVAELLGISGWVGASSDPLTACNKMVASSTDEPERYIVNSTVLEQALKQLDKDMGAWWKMSVRRRARLIMTEYEDVLCDDNKKETNKANRKAVSESGAG